MHSKIILTICILLVTNIFVFAQSKDYSEMSFTLENEQIVVQGVFKGEKMKLSLSTITPSSINYPKYSKHLRQILLRTDEEDLSDTYTPVSVVRGIRIDEVKVKRLLMFSFTTGNSKYQPDNQNDGVLGFDFFKNKIVQIDYPKRKIRVYKKNPYQDLIKSDHKKNDIAVMKFKLKRPKMLNKNAYAVIENTRFGNLTLNLLIDINQRSPFTLNDSFKPSYQDTSMTNDFRLGSLMLEDFEAEFVDKFEFMKTHNSALGSKFFQDYILTLDYKKKFMILEKPDSK